jgi:hypothetical protein
MNFKDKRNIDADNPCFTKICIMSFYYEACTLVLAWLVTWTGSHWMKFFLKRYTMCKQNLQKKNHITQSVRHTVCSGVHLTDVSWQHLYPWEEDSKFPVKSKFGIWKQWIWMPNQKKDAVNDGSLLRIIWLKWNSARKIGTYQLFSCDKRVRKFLSPVHFLFGQSHPPPTNYISPVQ